MADRIGVINNGKLILVDEKAQLMRKLGRKELWLPLAKPMEHLPDELKTLGLALTDGGHQMVYTFDRATETTDLPRLLGALAQHQVHYKDLRTRESSLEDIFVQLIQEKT